MAQTTAHSDIQIADLGGVWKRTLFVSPEGESDESSQVYWLQIGELAGDIRAALGADQAQTAFVSWLSKRDRVFNWNPIMRHGSVTNGSPDEGYLSFEGRRLREDGVHSPYLEYWERDEIGSDLDRAFEFSQPSGEIGFLIEIGRFAFCACAIPSGNVFVLAKRNGTEYGVLLAVGCPHRPGDIIAWPKRTADSISFEQGCFGSRFTADIRPISAQVEKERAYL